MPASTDKLRELAALWNSDGVEPVSMMLAAGDPAEQYAARFVEVIHLGPKAASATAAQSGSAVAMFTVVSNFAVSDLQFVVTAHVETSGSVTPRNAPPADPSGFDPRFAWGLDIKGNARNLALVE